MFKWNEVICPTAISQHLEAYLGVKAQTRPCFPPPLSISSLVKKQTQIRGALKNNAVS